MKLSATLSLLPALVPLSSSQSTGSGPYPAAYTTDPSLPSHTIYKPTTPTPASDPLPVLIWGNGACANDGTDFANFLTNIASYGYIAIASGPPGGTGSTNAAMMRDAIDFITAAAAAGTDGYETVDVGRIAVAGMSCGGLEAYELRDDERVSNLGIFNSGFLDGGEAISEVAVPVFYFLGGRGDIAYPNGMRDYAALQGVPKWVGNYPVGHGGTYGDPDGGAFGVAAVNWLQFVLKGDAEAAGFFMQGGAEAAGWQETASEGLEELL
ncbi:Alpha/Beta hydrolase protein [Aspergillus egyptiacus]|nr:Alpha/Beta hydrolase protein [Aspergillus egyptiacus]